MARTFEKGTQIPEREKRKTIGEIYNEKNEALRSLTKRILAVGARSNDCLSHEDPGYSELHSHLLGMGNAEFWLFVVMGWREMERKRYFDVNEGDWTERVSQLQLVELESPGTADSEKFIGGKVASDEDKMRLHKALAISLHKEIEKTKRLDHIHVNGYTAGQSEQQETLENHQAQADYTNPPVRNGDKVADDKDGGCWNFTHEVVFPCKSLITALGLDHFYDTDTAGGLDGATDRLEEMFTEEYRRSTSYRNDTPHNDEKYWTKKWVVWNERHTKFDFVEGVKVGDIVYLLGLQYRGEDENPTRSRLLDQFYSAFELYDPHEGHAYTWELDPRGMFTPEFYPRRYKLRDCLYEQDLYVLQQLIKWELTRYKRAGVTYVEWSIGLNDVTRPHVMEHLCLSEEARPSWTLKPRSSSDNVQDRPYGGVTFKYLAASPRTVVCPNLEPVDMLCIIKRHDTLPDRIQKAIHCGPGSCGEKKQAESSFTEDEIADSIDAELNYCDFLASKYVGRPTDKKRFEPYMQSTRTELSAQDILDNSRDFKTPVSDLLRKLKKLSKLMDLSYRAYCRALPRIPYSEVVVGLDWLSDELGRPYCLFSAPPPVGRAIKRIRGFLRNSLHGTEQLTSLSLPKSNGTFFLNRFGVRVHCGECVQVRSVENPHNITSAIRHCNLACSAILELTKILLNTYEGHAEDGQGEGASNEDEQLEGIGDESEESEDDDKSVHSESNTGDSEGDDETRPHSESSDGEDEQLRDRDERQAKEDKGQLEAIGEKNLEKGEGNDRKNGNEKQKGSDDEGDHGDGEKDDLGLPLRIGHGVGLILVNDYVQRNHVAEDINPVQNVLNSGFAFELNLTSNDSLLFKDSSHSRQSMAKAVANMGVGKIDFLVCCDNEGIWPLPGALYHADKSMFTGLAAELGKHIFQGIFSKENVGKLPETGLMRRFWVPFRSSNRRIPFTSYLRETVGQGGMKSWKTDTLRRSPLPSSVYRGPSVVFRNISFEELVASIRRAMAKLPLGHRGNLMKRELAKIQPGQVKKFARTLLHLLDVENTENVVVIETGKSPPCNFPLPKLNYLPIVQIVCEGPKGDPPIEGLFKSFIARHLSTAVTEDFGACLFRACKKLDEAQVWPKNYSISLNVICCLVAKDREKLLKCLVASKLQSVLLRDLVLGSNHQNAQAITTMTERKYLRDRTTVTSRLPKEFFEAAGEDFLERCKDGLLQHLTTIRTRMEQLVANETALDLQCASFFYHACAICKAVKRKRKANSRYFTELKKHAEWEPKTLARDIEFETGTRSEDTTTLLKCMKSYVEHVIRTVKEALREAEEWYNEKKWTNMILVDRDKSATTVKQWILDLLAEHDEDGIGLIGEIVQSLRQICGLGNTGKCLLKDSTEVLDFIKQVQLVTIYGVYAVNLKPITLSRFAKISKHCRTVLSANDVRVRTRVWTVKRLVQRDGDVVLVEWEGFVGPGSYTWESVSNLQNDLGIDALTDFLDELGSPSKPKRAEEAEKDVALLDKERRRDYTFVRSHGAALTRPKTEIDSAKEEAIKKRKQKEEEIAGNIGREKEDIRHKDSSTGIRRKSKSGRSTLPKSKGDT